MRILLVVHQLLPPRHVAGTEIYTLALARALRARGHAVHLFYTESYADRGQYTLNRTEVAGIPAHEAVHNYRFPDFRATWRDTRMEALFRQVLAEAAPDLVHLQHLHLHSLGYIDLAADRGLPLVYTLHEYLLLCPRGGQLLRPGLALCPGPEPAACAACVRGQAPLPAGLAAAPDPWVAAVEERRREIRARLDRVDLFLAPSAFLRERFLAAGLVAPERILHLDNGFETARRTGPARRGADRGLRVGYIGTLADYKGVHVLLEACRELDDPGVECAIHGSLEVFPEYGRRLLEMPNPPNVRLLGPYPHERVGEILSGLDVLVVPSLWYENSPLTIHEAFLAGLPVIASDIGGMAELVKDGVSGLLFRRGDAADLREKIRRLRREPELLDRLRGGLPAVTEIGAHAETVEDLYTGLLDA